MASALPDDTVTICIPAYQAGTFLAETVESALTQTHRAVRIVIAVDPGKDDTPRIARRYAGSRVSVIVNARRRGWIGNTNFALSQARSRYAMILPHDDVLEPDYVEACLGELKRHPGAVTCYSRIDILGNPTIVIGQESLLGDLQQRLVVLLASLFDSVAYRGVLDLQVAKQIAIPNSVASYAADTLWIARLACQGELIEVPSVHYHKRLLPTSAHAGWAPSGNDEFYEMWAVHCLEIVSVILATRPDLEWNGKLQAAWETRVRRQIAYKNVPLNPALADSTIDVGAFVTATADRVKARPVPYSWVKA